MNILLTPSPLAGTVAALPSKSQAHRLLLCAALADGPTVIECGPAGQDIDATVRCLRALGAQIDRDGLCYTVTPIRTARSALLEVGQCGATLRFLLPVVCALGCGGQFRLEGALPTRPLEPLWSELERHGARLSRTQDRITAGGQLLGHDFTLAADVSSQFLSALAMTLPLLGGGSIRLVGAPESAAYLHMTLDILRRFGADAALRDGTVEVRGTLHSPGHCTVEGDWSNAAFWLCANRLGSRIRVTGLDAASLQADRAFASLTESRLIDCRQIPDLVPPLAVLAAFRPGQTRFCHARRLRLKESDRIAACVALVRALGAQAAETDDGFTVEGQDRLPGGTVDAFGDHRIAMAAAIAGTRCPVTLLNAQAVEKSYAAFWTDYCRLGGSATWEDAT